MKLITIALIVMLAGPVNAEGLFLTVGAGKNHLSGSSTEWQGDDATGAFIALSWKFNKQAWCKCFPSINYAHISHYETGPPWNDEEESSIDHIGIAGTWALYER